MSAIVVAIITGVVSLLTGAGGVLIFINNRSKINADNQDLAVSEWKELYDEMKERLDSQEEENKKLRDELYELREAMAKLNLELQNYKKYGAYINKLEKYIDHLLHTFKTVSTEEAYKNMSAKRPINDSINA